MKYVIEGGIDFYAEINNTGINNDQDSKEDDNICLITKEPLRHNFITLPCSHKFNYLALYKEILLQKLNISSFETVTLLINEIKCPYCRSKFDKLLPYINYEGVIREKGINFPDCKCMVHRTCLWELKNGVKQGSTCNKKAYENLDESIPGAYCDAHWIQYVNLQKQKNGFTKEMEDYSKKKSVIELKKILREMKLTISGNKKQLVIRIFENKIKL
jgi:hypothetical protein